MPDQPEPGWLYVIRLIQDDLLPRFAEHRSAIEAIRERLDDWERDQDTLRRLHEKDVDIKLAHTGRNAEDALRGLEMHDVQHVRRGEVEQMRAAIDAHAKHHEGSQQASQAVTLAQLDSKTKIALAILAGLFGLVQFIAGLLIGGSQP